jgi:hypothetical protein
MKKIKITDFVILTSVAIIVLFSFSCNKPKPCKAIITVKDSAGIALQQGISVKLFATVTTQTGTTTADLTAEGTTDAKGQVEFTFKLPAIMDIRAEKPSCTSSLPSTDNTGQYIPGVYCKGRGIVKFEEKDEPNEKTVYLTY